ncbi:hypothetical protein C6P41_001226 [Kluyveromyces marxianus]|nr:hypothetical protein C6P43_001045 [Kluyveromyces marxianus]KAG0677997.1 hypothetical protein C6P41_001226 [Kluyveromyces marxianus]
MTISDSTIKIENTKPNFIIIVADDLGFSDLSSFGGEIETPNLDKLAKNGFRFTGFHTASACSPTRSMLLSGTDNHLAGLGQMAEYARQFPDLFKDKPGYEGVLNYRVASLAEILSPEYYSFISGKWHLGLEKPYWPSDRGFENSFTLLPGAGNHFKDKLENKIFLPWIYQENGQRIDPHTFPDNFYSSDYFTDKFLQYLDDTESRKDRPFFGLLTFTAPHWPLQAPPETIEKYKGKYDDGPFALRKRRLQRAKELGILSEEVVPHLVETMREKTWESLDDEQRRYESKIMEVYAAMVDKLDQNVGRLLDHLEETGEIENTVILFLSDNGAEGMLMEALPFGGKTFRERICTDYDNSFENIGKGNSFVYYGDLWAQAATAPKYMYKMWITEGGINCPLILHAPSLRQKWQEDAIIDEFTTVMDILPTILTLADIPHPGDTFKNRQVYRPKGVSWVPYLTKQEDTVYGQNKVVGWELFGQRAIREGRFKAVYIPPPFGEGVWALFDVKDDPGETNNISEQFPDVMERMLDHWSIYKSETGLVEMDDTYFKDIKYEKRVIPDSLEP